MTAAKLYASRGGAAILGVSQGVVYWLCARHGVGRRLHGGGTGPLLLTAADIRRLRTLRRTVRRPRRTKADAADANTDATSS